MKEAAKSSPEAISPLIALVCMPVSSASFSLMVKPGGAEKVTAPAYHSPFLSPPSSTRASSGSLSV
ncbi:hypothetical protein [Parabacteroides distasonis]|uniref:hypothetical protein n=1 Tax=Parabacteroides distasonis TaxID=823 RepID=UPI001E4BEC97|nr:hypothetical protein [Parabacteroides distasonis]